MIPWICRVSVLQSGVVCCSVLQHTRCSVLSEDSLKNALCLMNVSVCCSAVQCVAVCCSVLQCAATPLNSLKKTLCDMSVRHFRPSVPRTNFLVYVVIY